MSYPAPMSRRKPLPPEAERVLALTRKRLRPIVPAGSFVCALDWSLGTSWYRFVLPRDRDPSTYDLRFVRGLDLLVLYRPGHPPEHVRRACDELKANGARVVAPVQLPRLVE